VEHRRNFSGESPRQSTHDDGEDDRRCHARVRGPFDGLRIGLVDQSISIYDLSEGGCFVNSTIDMAPGSSRFDLKVDLPGEGWVLVTAEIVYSRSGYGFAVRFLELSDDTRAKLEQCLRRLRRQNA